MEKNDVKKIMDECSWYIFPTYNEIKSESWVTYYMSEDDRKRLIQLFEKYGCMSIKNLLFKIERKVRKIQDKELKSEMLRKINDIKTDWYYIKKGLEDTTKHNHLDIFISKDYHVFAVMYGNVRPGKHTLVKLYKTIPKNIKEECENFLMKVKEIENNIGEQKEEEHGKSEEKKPWEMTREEYISVHLPTILNNVKAVTPMTKASAIRKKALDIANMEYDKILHNAKLEGKIKSKEIGWQNTRHEIQEKIRKGLYPKDYLSSGAHKRAVTEALEKGRPVPPEVLKDYPELAERYRESEVQPWEMTKKEFDMEYYPPVVYNNTLVTQNGEPIKIGEEIFLHFAGSPNNMLSPVKLVSMKPYYSSVDNKIHTQITVEAKNGKRMTFMEVEQITPEGKEGEYYFHMSLKHPLQYNAHRYIVEQAIKEGKPVPPEVLKEYPDLAEKYRESEGQPQGEKEEKAPTGAGQEQFLKKKEEVFKNIRKMYKEAEQNLSYCELYMYAAQELGKLSEELRAMKLSQEERNRLAVIPDEIDHLLNIADTGCVNQKIIAEKQQHEKQVQKEAEEQQEAENQAAKERYDKIIDEMGLYTMGILEGMGYSKKDAYTIIQEKKVINKIKELANKIVDNEISKGEAEADIEDYITPYVFYAGTPGHKLSLREEEYSPAAEQQEVRRPSRKESKFSPTPSRNKYIKFVIKNWKGIVEKGLKNYVKEKQDTYVNTREELRTIDTVKEYLRDNVHADTVAEWLISLYPKSWYILVQIITLGINSPLYYENMEKWYTENKKEIEYTTGLDMPPFQEFISKFREFLLNYKFP